MSDIRKLFAGMLIACSALSGADSTGRQAYIESYTKHVNAGMGVFVTMFEKQGATKDDAENQAQEFSNKIIGCHKNTLEIYPEKIRSALYETVSAGGSYPDAESELKRIVGEAQLSADEEIMTPFIAATRANMECIKG